MIEVTCQCARPRKAPESAVGKRLRCSACKQTILLASAEALADGAGGGDFDASLTVLAGPAHVGMKILLGGIADITIGSLPSAQIVLPGPAVSGIHCKLVRIDFGPSRWKLVDEQSSKGLFVNDDRVSEHELQDGDIIRVGDYDLSYAVAIDTAKAATATASIAATTATATTVTGAPKPKMPPATAAAVSTALAPHGGRCPSCEKSLPPSAKICVDCGIDVRSGRPVLTRHGMDEDAVHEAAAQWIRWVSLIVWFTPMPIPIRSEAFGTKKPYAIWVIAIITAVASILFFIAQSTGDGSGGKNLMLWAPSGQAGAFKIDRQKVHEIAKDLTAEERDELRQKYDPRGRLSDDDLIARLATDIATDVSAERGQFHAYQLITHAFLHDTSSIYNFAMHLAGNMLFLLVFGTRVNALIGNLATAIVYPILAVCAAAAHLASLGDASSGPMVGASGAIMGLAGMYLVLFPAHQVLCAMWFSLWLRFRRLYGCKIFSMRGFWVLLIYFGYDVLMNAVSAHFGIGGGVAHWAHIGGFLTGAALGLAILFSRQFNTHGGDLLSVTLGKNAWPLIGKPSRWIATPTA